MMPQNQITKTRLRAGVWQGVLTAGPNAPELDVWHLESPVQGVTVTALADMPNHYLLSVPIPLAALNDGVQSFVIQNRATGETYGSFAIIAGDALDEDLRAEIDLLRAELDLLKRAFRRHCVETA
jgi:hypothetical protein